MEATKNKCVLSLTEGELVGLVRLPCPGSHDSAVNSTTIIAHVIWAHLMRGVFYKECGENISHSSIQVEYNKFLITVRYKSLRNNQHFLFPRALCFLSFNVHTAIGVECCKEEYTQRIWGSLDSLWMCPRSGLDIRELCPWGRSRGFGEEPGVRGGARG